MFSLLLALMLTDWPALVPAITKQIPRLEATKGTEKWTCSAVVFEIDADGFAHALTAAHCVDRQPSERLDVTVNGRTAGPVSSNAILDLAVVKFRARDEKPITIATTEPLPGAEVAIIGYAFGEDDLVAQFGHIAQSFNKPSRTTWVDATLIFGDSGGACVDNTGALVGINSAIKYQGPARIGMVVSVSQILDYLDAYRAQLKAQAKK